MTAETPIAPASSRGAAQAASVLALQGQVDEATTWLVRASERANEDVPLGWSRVLLARGLTAWKEERRADAAATFAELYAYCLEHGETVRAIQAAQMASVVSDDAAARDLARWPIRVPPGTPEWLGPIVSIVAGQLHAMHLTRARGLDPDAPRNLNKVTRTR